MKKRKTKKKKSIRRVKKAMGRIHFSRYAFFVFYAGFLLAAAWAIRVYARGGFFCFT